MHSLNNFQKKQLLQNLESIIDSNVPIVSNLSNISKLIFDTMTNTSWCGFYLANETFDTLYLGPFQGDIACTKILFGRGVCGNAALLQKTQLVPNVHEYPGHIACSSLTNSEIVVPIVKNGKCVAVLDLDSHLFNNYNDFDTKLLEEVAKIISKLF